jgi:peptide/nickel transport system ATP-binding protein/oligopeptide transport system ATP-binding protein
MVMYAGQVVEEGATVDVISNPQHPYTRGLLGSIPRLSLRGQPIRPIQGQVPNLVGLPPQCRFYSRCPVRTEACLQSVEMRSVGPDRRARCIALTQEEVA